MGFTVIGVYDGICKIHLLMGLKWASQFEVYILHMEDEPSHIDWA